MVTPQQSVITQGHVHTYPDMFESAPFSLTEHAHIPTSVSVLYRDVSVFKNIRIRPFTRGRIYSVLKKSTLESAFKNLRKTKDQRTYSINRTMKTLAENKK